MARRRKGEIPAIEWIGGAIGVLIVLGTIAYLAYETLRDADEAVLTVSVVGVREQAGSFAVDIEVRNTGRAAAADVHIAAALPSPERRDTAPRARIDYVPGLSSRQVTLLFSSHPGEHPDVRVVGYAKP